MLVKPNDEIEVNFVDQINFAFDVSITSDFGEPQKAVDAIRELMEIFYDIERSEQVRAIGVIMGNIWMVRSDVLYEDHWIDVFLHILCQLKEGKESKFELDFTEKQLGLLVDWIADCSNSKLMTGRESEMLELKRIFQMSAD